MGNLMDRGVVVNNLVMKLVEMDVAQVVDVAGTLCLVASHKQKGVENVEF